MNDRQLTSSPVSRFPPAFFWDTDIRPVDNGEMAANDVEGVPISGFRSGVPPVSMRRLDDVVHLSSKRWVGKEPASHL